MKIRGNSSHDGSNGNGSIIEWKWKKNRIEYRIEYRIVLNKTWSDSESDSARRKAKQAPVDRMYCNFLCCFFMSIRSRWNMLVKIECCSTVSFCVYVCVLERLRVFYKMLKLITLRRKSKKRSTSLELGSVFEWDRMNIWRTTHS